MSHTFKYPDTTAPTVTLTFTTALFRGDDPYYSRNQNVEVTHGGTPRVVSKGENLRYYPLTVRVPVYSASGTGHVTDWNDVESFINDTVDFELREFWWTDDDGVMRRVRMENDSSEPDESYVSMNKYRFVLRVFEEIQPA